MPTPHFGSWTAWTSKDEIEGADLTGVYLLARFDHKPKAEPGTIRREIVYIGETCNQSLSGRWWQFDRSGFQRKDGHSGGWTFSKKFCNEKVCVPVPWLYIAALPVSFDEPNKRSAYIRYVERLMIWRYVEQFDELPACNSK